MNEDVGYIYQASYFVNNFN